MVSLRPTVNSLDDYAVGFKRYVNVQPDDILQDRFIGLVKRDGIQPKKLYKPVLLDNDNCKLLFHSNPLFEKNLYYSRVEESIAEGVSNHSNSLGSRI